MEYEISFEVPHQIFVIDADDEFDAAEKIKGQMDGITIDESFRFEDLNILGIREKGGK